MKRLESRRASAAALTWAQVMAWRAGRHHLVERAPERAVADVASGICGLHAQLMTSAELSALARVQDLAPGAIERALWRDRSLVKLWAMRGTLHLLPSREYALWQSALEVYRSFFQRPSWARGFGISAREAAQLLPAISGALERRPLTREELASEVARSTGSKNLGQKLLDGFGPLLKPASYMGLLCFAPGDGQSVRFTRPDRWLHAGDKPPTDGALAQLARRFVAAYAPVALDDWARWWRGLTPAQAKKSIAGAGEDLVLADVEGYRGWMLQGDVERARALGPLRAVRLLPAFDPYVVGATKHARRLMAGNFAGRIYRPQAWLSPVLLVGGRMDGVWSHEVKGRRVAIRIEPFAKLEAWARAQAEEEASRVARFLGGELELTWAFGATSSSARATTSAGP